MVSPDAQLSADTSKVFAAIAYDGTVTGERLLILYESLTHSTVVHFFVFINPTTTTTIPVEDVESENPGNKLGCANLVTFRVNENDNRERAEMNPVDELDTLNAEDVDVIGTETSWGGVHPVVQSASVPYRPVSV